MQIDTKQKQKDQRLPLFARVSEFILFILLIIYAILSQSLFSTIGVLFLMLGICADITQIYYLNQKQSRLSILPNNQIQLRSYPIQRIIWIFFSIFNFVVLFFKVVVLGMNLQSEFTQVEQEFYQVQSLAVMFVPVIIIPFSLGAIFITPTTKQLMKFKKEISSKIQIPLYFVLGGLTILIQIWTQSFIGLFFFVISLCIFCVQSTNFSSILYKLIVILIQITTLLVISFTLLASTSYFQSFQLSTHYDTIGIDGILNFYESVQQRGHFITEISLFLYCCLLQRFFQYQRIHKIALQKISQHSINQSQIFGEQITLREAMNLSPTSMIKQNLIDPKRGKTSIFQTGKQYELTQLYREKQKFRFTHEPIRQPLPQNISKRKQFSNINKKSVLKIHEENKSKRSSITSRSQKTGKIENQPNKYQIIWEIFLKTVNNMINFLNSADFSLRVAQILAIVIIQRYNNIYSFVVLLWLAMIASVQNLKFVYLATAIVVLPSEIINFIIMFLYSVPDSFIPEMDHLSIWGFQILYLYWLDVLIFNIFLYYLILFISAAAKQTRLSLYSKSKTVSEPTNFILICAFIFRYTYLFTIIGMFVLGFSDINLVNLGYVILFFLFFTFGEKITLESKLKKKKQANGKQKSEKIYVLTTLSRQFWFVIVYYTLIIIVLKYIYFLWFKQQAGQVLDPIGINQTYNWPFNFSLTEVCKSNTTPFFIIFVLAQSQIIIHRSNIYLNYSFSLIASSNDRNLNENKDQKFSTKYQLLKRVSTQVLRFSLELYYQGLYYFSGIIILACSYSWNIVQVPIVILVCIGLLSKFGKKILISIISIDLVFLFLTYIFRFLNFPAIQTLFGQNLTQVFRKIALFCGFNLDPDQSLYSIIILNVVIIYFSVQSYRLFTKLNENGTQNSALNESFRSELEKKKKRKSQLPLNQYEPTVIDSQFEDKTFAVNYHQGVIEATKTYYNTDMIRKYTWLRYTCKFFSFIIVDAVSIIVLVCCLYFRLSFSMFAFLVIYLVFYFFLFDRIGKYMSRVNYFGKIQAYLTDYNLKQQALKEKQNPKKIVINNQKLQQLKEFIQISFKEILNLKYSWKKSLWIYSAIFSVICLLFTYIAQFMISDFYVQYINWSETQSAEDFLFVCGFSVNNQTSFFSQVYFYYLMIIINVIQKFLINFYYQQREVQQAIMEVKKEFKQIIKVETPQFLIHNPQITHDFVIQSEQFQKLDHLQDEQIESEVIAKINSQDYQKQVISTCNLLIYFNFKSVQVKINLIFGLLSGMVRCYLWLMLVNVYQKSNFSAFLYLFSLLYFWFRRIQFNVVKQINKAAIVIFLIQYLMLLLDLQQNTSPLPLPNGGNLSLLQKYVIDPQWLEFLVIGKGDTQTQFIFVSFLINSVIIFVTEVYFSGVQHISKLCLHLTQQIWNRYNYIYSTILKTEINQTLDLNYQSYKSWGYRVLEFTYENFIVNSYVFASILILLVLSADHTYVSLGLLIIVFIYIYLGLYTNYGSDGKIYKYTKLFYQIFRIILFCLITISLILDIPVLIDASNAVPDNVGIEVTLSYIFLILFMQLWLDSTVSSQFKRVTVRGLINNHRKQHVRLQCLAYQSNNSFVASLVKSFKEILTFQISIKQAQNIIKQWENSFKVQEMESKVLSSGVFQKQKQDRQQPQPQKISPALKALRNQIKKQIRKEDQMDEQQFSLLEELNKFLQRNTNCSLSYSYFQLMKYILKNNRNVLAKILNKQKINIDIWDYILEDYIKLEDQIAKCNEKLVSIGEKIIQEQQQFRMDLLQYIIEDQYINADQLQSVGKQGLQNNKQGSQKNIQSDLYKVTTPKKINLVINRQKQERAFSGKIWFWFLTNFTYFMLFLVCIFYVLNPSLLSLPIIIYIFSFYVISNKKYNNVMLVYIFIIIILGELFQLNFLSESGFTKYLFYLSDDGTYQFSIGFLFFLFVIIFIDQQIKKFQGVNKIHQSEAQNFQTGSLRILINEQKGSQIYLWRMYFQDLQQYEKSNNPILYAAEKISQNPTNLMNNKRSSFFECFYTNKKGIDLYPYIATVQIFLTIYLIFFYPLMTLIDQKALSESYKYFTFSANMIIAILAHIFVVVVQRNITLISSQNKHKQLIKYVFTMMIFVVFLIFIYYWASYRPPQNYQAPPALIAFSFFYFIYFFLSGIQVKYGYKKFKRINSFMVKRNTFSYYFMMIFIAVPFLYQIKCIMDWTFLKTSLQVFDWFKLFSIYVSSFKAKIQQTGVLDTRLGDQITWGKIIGWVGFTILLLIIFGPMILFSGLNPASETNLVNGGSFQVGIHVIGGNQFTLYSTSHFSAPPTSVNSTQFNQNGLNDVPLLQGLSDGDLLRQFQSIYFQPYSDNFWGISSPNYDFLKTAFNLSTSQINSNVTPTTQYRMTIQYIFNRQVTQTTAHVTTFQFPNDNGSLSNDVVSQMNTTLHQCNSSVTIPGFYNNLIRLITSGTTYKPSPIFYPQEDGSQRFSQNVTLTMVCDTNDSVQTENTNNIYWEVTLEGTTNGIQMYVFSDLYQSILGGLSFTAIYTSVILVVAGFIRSLLAGNLPLIPYQMNAKPQKILLICQAIGIHRDRNQFKEEFLMYYELIDIIRSPEVIRKIGASYTNLIVKNDRVRRYKQMTKQQKERKKNL